MKVIFLSSDIDIINEWEKKTFLQNHVACYDLESLETELQTSDFCVVIADYDSANSDINKLISSNSLPDNTIILEKSPEIATGKMLISHNIKAYGNSRMLEIHYKQMIKTVQNNNIWTYPELTAALVKSTKKSSLNENSKKILNNRLSKKETDVVYLILEGMTNNAIANEMDITTRTVKAHVSSIFIKLHVNDRLSLVLLLK